MIAKLDWPMLAAATSERSPYLRRGAGRSNGVATTEPRRIEGELVMADACKCDRCGEYFDKPREKVLVESPVHDGRVEVCIAVVKVEPAGLSPDMCNTCLAAVAAWFIEKVTGKKVTLED